VFKRRRWFVGRPLFGEKVTDIGWFKFDGTLMTDEDWKNGFARTIGVFLNGDALPDPDSRGERITDVSFHVLFNAHYEDMPFTLPQSAWGERWVKVIDTSQLVPDLRDPMETHAGQEIKVQAHSIVVLKRNEHA